MPETASGHSDAALSALRQRLHAGIQEMQVEAVGLTPPLNEAFSRIRNATKMLAGDKVGAVRHDQIMQVSTPSWTLFFMDLLGLNRVACTGLTELRVPGVS